MPMLAVTLHGGEKPDPVELAMMVDYHPNRWGHLVFTDPDSLRRIISADDPIELCITSNIISSGHADVGQHHLATVIEQARELRSEKTGNTALVKKTTLVEGLLDGRSYMAAQRQRLNRRIRRFLSPHRARKLHTRDISLEEGSMDGEGGAPMTAVIPNISFHTDDRGIFDITLTHEIFTLLKHSDVLNDHSIAEQRVVEAIWRLERLTIANVFELPWAILVMLIAARVNFSDQKMANNEVSWREFSDQRSANGVQCEESASQLVFRKLSDVQNLSELKENWGKFEEYILLQQEAANGNAGNPFGELWSGVEWAWLTQCFDEFYTTENIQYD
ncbi:unnamed protein product [Phytomonas sp. Hart1]|nr:unnamed protein product [Phytomonas sp. Hart1]|eukprot:CCW71377.1 unnamed protein product [Phytomonas sp. isolate Hart1]